MDYDLEELGVGLGERVARGPSRSRALRGKQPGSAQITNIPQVDIAGYSQRARDLQDQASTLMNQQPDVSQHQQYAQQRSEQGGNALVMALAAQRAGKGFEGVGGHYLKQAMAAQEPINVGKAGMVTPQGQFIEDPTFGREQRVTQLLQQAQKYDQMAANAINAQERAAAQIEAQRTRAETQALMFGARLDTAAARLDLARQGRQQTDDMQRMRLEDSMSNQFNQVTKDIAEELSSTKKVAQLAPSMLGRRPNAMEQQSMIVLLNKFLDPGSVVREGEFDRVARAQGLVDRANNLIARMARGELMSDKLIAEIVQMSQFYENAAKTKLNALGDEYATLATQRGLDPRSVVRNVDYKPRDQRAPRQPATSGGFSIRRLD